MKFIVLSIVLSFSFQSFSQLLKVSSEGSGVGLIASGYDVMTEMKFDSAYWCKDRMYWYGILGKDGFYQLYHFDTISKKIDQIKGEPFTDFSLWGKNLQVNDSLGNVRWFDHDTKGWNYIDIPVDSAVAGVNSAGKWALIKNKEALTPYVYSYLSYYTNHETDEREEIYQAYTDSGIVVLSKDGEQLYPYAVSQIRKVNGYESRWVAQDENEEGEWTFGWFDPNDEKYYAPPMHIMDYRSYFEMDDEVYLLSGPPYIVEKNGQWGLMSKKFEMLIEYEYDLLYFLGKYYPEKFLLANSNGKWMVINQKNKVIQEIEIDDWIGVDYVREDKTNYGLVISSGRLKYFDLKKFVIVERELKLFGNKTYRRTTPDGRRGEYDAQGNIIVPFE